MHPERRVHGAHGAHGANRINRIFLVGLMASGKSTVGSLLATTLGCDYLDNDTVIGDLAGRSTVELAARGGPLLHTWEARYDAYVAGYPPPVVAGIPASAADRPADLVLLREAGLLAYLRCDPATLAARIKAGPPRPWITGDPATLVEQMYADRDPILARECPVVLDGTTTPQALARLISAIERGDTPPDM